MLLTHHIEGRSMNMFIGLKVNELCTGRLQCIWFIVSMRIFVQQSANMIEQVFSESAGSTEGAEK